MVSSRSFSLVREPLENVPRRVEVIDVEDLTPTYRRIRLRGDFGTFESRGSDDHLRIFFTPADFDMADVAGIREHPSREFTPAAWTAETLTLDFVLHGAGPATTWARQAAADATAVIGGPRGSLVLEGEPDWWLLAGDRTALPAIRRFLGEVRAGKPVDVVVIAEDPADEQRLDSAGDLRVRWVASLDDLLVALAELPARPGDGFAFVAAEQAVVKPARELLEARGVELDRAVVKGYWKRGEAGAH